MSKYSKSKNSKKLGIVFIITGVVILIVSVFVAVYFARFTNGFQDDYKSIYVQYNGKSITADTTGFRFNVGTKYQFDVKYTLGNKGNYSLAILPNAEEDFTFTVGGEERTFSAEEDFSEYFNVTIDSNGFSLIAEKNLPEMLSDRYSGLLVSGVPSCYSKEYKDKDLFLIAVYSEDKSSQIKIGFNTAFVFDGIKLNSNHLVF